MNSQNIGLFLIVLAGLFLLGEKLPFVGHLPGDVRFHGRHSDIFMPLGTCLLVSVLVSLVLTLLAKR